MSFTLRKRQPSNISIANERLEKRRRIQAVLEKNLDDRTEEERSILTTSPEVVKSIERSKRKKVLIQARRDVQIDSGPNLTLMVKRLAHAINHSNLTIVYTGAGISTAANIPDYRGPDGVWTRFMRGEAPRKCSIVEAQPTFSHMALAALMDHGYITHVLSQNCDGLHIRSGIDPTCLSEVHGNMFIEVCTNCEPERLYHRLFDVTENTGFQKHRSARKCHYCNQPLRDSIVHFGERDVTLQPQNWETAERFVPKADLILCIGSSLQILKAYKQLFTFSNKKKKPQLFIVNLEWTPKDFMATCKIHATADTVMSLLCEELSIDVPQYSSIDDPLFHLAIPLKEGELDTFTTKCLSKEKSFTTESQDVFESPGWFKVGYQMMKRCRQRYRHR